MIHNRSRPVTFLVQESPTVLVGWLPVGRNLDSPERIFFFSRFCSPNWEIPPPSTAVTTISKRDNEQEPTQIWRMELQKAIQKVPRGIQEWVVVGISTKVRNWRFRRSSVLQTEKHSGITVCVKFVSGAYSPRCCRAEKTCRPLTSTTEMITTPTLHKTHCGACLLLFFCCLFFFENFTLEKTFSNQITVL